MAEKFEQHYLKPSGWDTNKHFLVGVVWPVVGSTGNKYEVKLHNEGFTCDCLGFSYRGKCKHSQGVLNNIERQCL